MSTKQIKSVKKNPKETGKNNKGSVKRKVRVVDNPEEVDEIVDLESMPVNTRSEAAPTKDLYPDVIVLNKESDHLDKIITIDDQDFGSQPDNSEKSMKDILLALKLQWDERAQEIELLKREHAQDRVEKEKRMEARVTEKLRKHLRAELYEVKEVKEKRELFFRNMSQKIERPFKKFKFPGDQRYYDQLQELKALLEEAEIHLVAELPESSKAWNPLKELATKLKSFEEDVVVAQASKHGWKVVDSYHDKVRGYRFIEDPEKAKGLKEIEKELDRESRE